MAGKKINFKLVFILTLLITSLLAFKVQVWGNNPQFRLDIDSLNLSRGESATLAVSIVNAQNAEIVDIEGIDNFKYRFNKYFRRHSNYQLPSNTYKNLQTCYNTKIYWRIFSCSKNKIQWKHLRNQ